MVFSCFCKTGGFKLQAVQMKEGKVKRLTHCLTVLLSLIWVFGSHDDLAFASKFPCDVTRLTMGRTTNPAESLVFQLINISTYPDWSDATQDTQQSIYEIEYGVTDRFTTELILVTRDQQREDFRLDKLLFRAQYRILDEPFQFTPYLDLLPSIHSEPLEIRYGFKALRNIENWTILFTDKGFIAKPQGASDYTYKYHELEPGLYYRFGLRGLTGVSWKYATDGNQAATYFIGGSISKNVFIGVDNAFGITRDEPDYVLTVNVTIYTGTSALGSYGLE